MKVHSKSRGTAAEADGIQWITPTLAFWEAYDPAVKCDLTGSALVTDAGLVIVDPIALPESALAELIARAKPAAILLTNGNHARSSVALRERIGVRIFAPAGAGEGLGFAPDVLLAEGEMAPGPMRIVGLPGAGPGEVAYVGGGVAMMGDALINLEPHGLRLLPEKYCANAAELRDELRKLLSCAFATMTFAHGAPLIRNTRQRLEDLLA